MSRGRPPKPLSLHTLHNTRRKHRHGEPGTEVHAEGKPSPPSWIKGEALQFWNAIVPQLEDMGILGAVDSSQLSQLCQAWVNYRKIQNRFDRNRATIHEVGHATRTFSELAGNFGLNPVARARLVTVTRPDSDVFLEILRGNLN